MEPQRERFAVGRARQQDAAVLSDIAFRSKAYWGYDETFTEACRYDLMISPLDIASRSYYLVERGGQALGLYNLGQTDRGVYLENLFVAPEAIGQGLGKLLWWHMTDLPRFYGVVVKQF